MFETEMETDILPLFVPYLIWSLLLLILSIVFWCFRACMSYLQHYVQYLRSVLSAADWQPGAGRIASYGSVGGRGTRAMHPCRTVRQSCQCRDGMTTSDSARVQWLPSDMAKVSLG